VKFDIHPRARGVRACGLAVLLAAASGITTASADEPRATRDLAWRLVRAATDAEAAVFERGDGNLVLVSAHEALGTSGFRLEQVRGSSVILRSQETGADLPAYVELARRASLAEALGAMRIAPAVIEHEETHAMPVTRAAAHPEAR